MPRSFDSECAEATNRNTSRNSAVLLPIQKGSEREGRCTGLMQSSRESLGPDGAPVILVAATHCLPPFPRSIGRVASSRQNPSRAMNQTGAASSSDRGERVGITRLSTNPALRRSWRNSLTVLSRPPTKAIISMSRSFPGCGAGESSSTHSASSSAADGRPVRRPSHGQCAS